MQSLISDNELGSITAQPNTALPVLNTNHSSLSNTVDAGRNEPGLITRHHPPSRLVVNKFTVFGSVLVGCLSGGVVAAGAEQNAKTKRTRDADKVSGRKLKATRGRQVITSE